MKNHGSLALVGSGEYLPQMKEFEQSLINDGLANNKKPIYIQIPTAAARESENRINYWRSLGEVAAKSLGVTQSFLPILTRDDANNLQLLKNVDDAALIYLSGGDPHYLAETLRDTLLWDLILKNWQSGGSLAGCSAGAMAFSGYVPHFRLSRAKPTQGFGLLKEVRVIPHFDKFFKWIPDSAAKHLLDLPGDSTLIGIDEDTAVVRRANQDWQVWGKGKLHLLKGQTPGQFGAGEFVNLGGDIL
jgi:cyanophycinase|uniref:Type 1 glutamine amidotransferase-like domain-containing protein n=1 Tax=Candidatus Nanopelagicus sp. TaxID=2518620 RepID=UPI00404B14CA